MAKPTIDGVRVTLGNRRYSVLVLVPAGYGGQAQWGPVGSGDTIERAHKNAAPFLCGRPFRVFDRVAGEVVA